MTQDITPAAHRVLASFLSQPLRMTRDYGSKSSQIDEYPQQAYATVECPSCGHQNRFSAGQSTCASCSSVISYKQAATEEKPYTHQDLVEDFKKSIDKGDIQSGQGLFETLSDVQERVVPQIEKYIEFYTTPDAPGKPEPKDDPLPQNFRKQVGMAAKAYSEFFSRLGEINELLHRTIKLALDNSGGKDHAIITTLEEIAETGSKQGFKKLKSLGFTQWEKGFVERAKHIHKAVEGLNFK